MRIAFLVGDIVTISGGSNVILEHADGLQALGHEVWLVPPVLPEEGVGTWHPKLEKLHVAPIAATKGVHFDFVFATWWLTWFDLHQIDADVYGYFNQSYESRFHPERHYKLQNRATYSVPILFVTEAHWLERFIQTLQPGAEVAYVPNGLSREYFPVKHEPPHRTGPLRVLVEGPWGVPFKGVPAAFAALEQASKSMDLEVGWLTSNSANARPLVGGKPVRVREKLPIDRVADVLRQHDVMLKLSTVEGMFGPPLEMFSQAGTAITAPVSGDDEYIVHGQNALVVSSFGQSEAIVRSLKLLSENPDFLLQLRWKALKTAQAWPDWPTATRRFADALENLKVQGYNNAHLRAALSGVSAMRGHWLDDVWAHEAERRQVPHFGHGEQLLMARYRKLKSAAAMSLLKKATPPALKDILRKYALKVLE